MTFLFVEDEIDISEDSLALIGGEDNRLVQDFRLSPVAYLARRVFHIQLHSDILTI